MLEVLEAFWGGLLSDKRVVCNGVGRDVETR